MIYLILALAAGYIFVAGYVLGFAERDNYYGATWWDWLYAAFWLPFLSYYLYSVLLKKELKNDYYR
ncbi:Uncharacterised protein [Serratia entomophila]|uniref:hypothetical protein n=1 Tax=Serratia entomophila TaxID=42906 RepID=UPI00217BA334|nr:hypothetical protein [Serratia entomophila]CAI1207774.1 Uncharacterised protein [Serratia entomophila]CAI2147684.1 Uncharacterised protein [Serratia entomophila]